jgi:hypothetical protein
VKQELSEKTRNDAFRKRPNLKAASARRKEGRLIDVQASLKDAPKKEKKERKTFHGISSFIFPFLPLPWLLAGAWSTGFYFLFSPGDIKRVRSLSSTGCEAGIS